MVSIHLRRSIVDWQEFSTNWLNLEFSPVQLPVDTPLTANWNKHADVVGGKPPYSLELKEAPRDMKREGLTLRWTPSPNDLRQSATFTTPLANHGSDFARRVWSELRRIPPGQTRSYSDIAHAIGRPSATRAVARANGANRIALIIPCHRVIGADGSLTGYGGGLWRKQKLIELERSFVR